MTEDEANNQNQNHQAGEAEIYDTEDVEITCIAENGLPEPNIQWFLNTRQIDFKANEYKKKFEIMGCLGNPKK